MFVKIAFGIINMASMGVKSKSWWNKKTHTFLNQLDNVFSLWYIEKSCFLIIINVFKFKVSYQFVIWYLLISRSLPGGEVAVRLRGRPYPLRHCTYIIVSLTLVLLQFLTVGYGFLLLGAGFALKGLLGLCLGERSLSDSETAPILSDTSKANKSSRIPTKW